MARLRPGMVQVRFSGALADVNAFLAAMRAAGFDLSGRAAPHPNRADPGYRVYRNAWPPAGCPGTNDVQGEAAHCCQATRRPAAAPSPTSD